MALEKNHQKCQIPLAPYQSAMRPRPCFGRAPKLGKAGGQRRNRLTLWSFQRAVRVSELGRWAGMGRRGLGKHIRPKPFVRGLVISIIMTAYICVLLARRLLPTFGMAIIRAGALLNSRRTLRLCHQRLIRLVLA